MNVNGGGTYLCGSVSVAMMSDRIGTDRIVGRSVDRGLERREKTRLEATSTFMINVNVGSTYLISSLSAEIAEIG